MEVLPSLRALAVGAVNTVYALDEALDTWFRRGTAAAAAVTSPMAAVPPPPAPVIRARSCPTFLAHPPAAPPGLGAAAGTCAKAQTDPAVSMDVPQVAPVVADAAAVVVAGAGAGAGAGAAVAVASRPVSSQQQSQPPCVAITTPEQEVEFRRACGVTRRRMLGAVQALSPDVVKMCSSEDGYTLLHIACLRGADVAVVKALLELGAVVNAVSNDGYTPLALACQHAGMAVVEALMSSKWVDPWAGSSTINAFTVTKKRREETVLRTLLRLDEGDEIPMCVICMSDDSDARLSACGHLFCQACMTEFLAAAISEGATFDSLKCPSDGCRCGLTATELASGTTPAQRDVLDQNSLRAALTAMPDFVYCPRCPNGGGVVTHTDCGDVVCMNGHEFCAQCRLPQHKHMTCAEFKQTPEYECIKWEMQNARPCPKCSAPIQKDGGCSHMTCKSCTYEFCWLCKGKYVPGKYTFGTKCPCPPRER